MPSHQSQTPTHPAQPLSFAFIAAHARAFHFLFSAPDEATVPLERIQEQLRRKLKSLKQELYELINADYPAFMTLANGLQGVEEHSSSLRAPLVDLAHAAEALRLGARSRREAIEAAVTKRLAVERRRRGVARCLQFMETLREAEALLGLGGGEEDHLAVVAGDELAPPTPWKKDAAPAPAAPPTATTATPDTAASGGGTGGGEEEEDDDENDDGGSDDDDDIDDDDDDDNDNHDEDAAEGTASRGAGGRSTARRSAADEACVLERCAHSSLRLLADLRSSDAAGAPRMHVLAVRARALQQEVLARLTAAFVAQVTPPDRFAYASGQVHGVARGALAPVLRGLAVLERGAQLERHFGGLVLGPFLAAHLTAGRLDAGGRRGACRGLTALYGATVAYIRSACGATLRLNEELFGDATAGSGGDGGAGAGASSALVVAGSSQPAPEPAQQPRPTMAVDLLVNGVWAHLCHALVAKLGDHGLFGLGDADVAHANYTATLQLLRDVEAIALPEQPTDGANGANSHAGEGTASARAPDAASVPASASALAVRAAVRRRLEAHPATTDLWRRWNLPVYFQLRASQLMALADDALKTAASHGCAKGTLLALPAASEAVAPEAAVPPSEAGPAPCTAAAAGLELALFGSFHEALASCWRAETMWVRPLSHKFLRLSLQLVGRLALWLNALLEGKVKSAPLPPPPAATAGAAIGAAAGLDGLAGNPKTPGDAAALSAAAAGGGGAVAAAAPPAAWVPGAGDLVRLASDARRLARWLEGDLAGHAARLVVAGGTVGQEEGQKEGQEEGDAAAAAAVAAALRGAAGPLRAVSGGCWERVVKEVAAACEREVGAVRGVTAAYRMTNKPSPTGPSPFVPALLQPLAAFAEAFDAKAPERDADGPGAAPGGAAGGAAGGGGGASAWRLAVLGLVAELFAETVTELLATVRTMDEALKKRAAKTAKSKAAAGGGGGGGAVEKLSDADKIGLQLWLDAAALRKDLAAHGLDVAACAPLGALQAQLEPFGAFLGRS